MRSAVDGLRVYLAGPMRAKPLYNHPAFNEAAAWLMEAGATEVFNPAAHDIAMGFDPVTATEEECKNFDLRGALEADLTWICRNADAIVFLPDSDISEGAKTEMQLGKALGIQVLSYKLISSDEMRDALQGAFA